MRDDLVRVDALVGLLATGELLDQSVTAGMRVEPPTRTTWSMSESLMPASLMTFWNGCLGPVEQVLGHLLELGAGERLVEVDGAVLAHREVLQVDVGRSVVEDSSFLACSAASRSRCMAILSLDRSTPVLFFTVVSSQ
jgi:hypothetical protein